MRGKCWSYGGRTFPDPEHGGYWQFVLKVPSTVKTPYGKVRVYVHWYRAKFEPEAGMRLECNGSIVTSAVQEIIDKPPRINLTLVCFGDEVQLQNNKKPSK